MADSTFGSILKLGLLGGAAYFAWNWWQGMQAPAAAGSTSGSSGGSGSGSTPPPPPAPPSYTYTPPTLTQALITAVSTNPTYIANGGKLNADQWNYFYTQLRPNAPIPGDVFTQLFFPSGRPADPSSNPLFDAATFVAAIGPKGFSGLGAPRVLAIPSRSHAGLFTPPAPFLVPGARPFPGQMLGRKRNYVRAGSPMGAPINYIPTGGAS